MNDELRQLFRLLQMLLDSCAEHDPITDAFVTPADRDTYDSVLEKLQECTSSNQDSSYRWSSSSPCSTDLIVILVCSLLFPHPVIVR